MAKIENLKKVKATLIESQEQDLSFKSASEGMGLKEDMNAIDHVLKDRNRDISLLSKEIRKKEKDKVAKVMAPPKSLYYFDDKTGQSFIDEVHAKKREEKSFWGGVLTAAAIGGVLWMLNKKNKEA